MSDRADGRPGGAVGDPTGPSVPPRPIPDGGHWADALARWEAAGIVDARTAASVRAFEATSTAPVLAAVPAGAPTAPPPSATVTGSTQGGRRSRVPVVAEVVGYLGAGLAMAAIGLLVSSFWTDLAPGARALAIATIAASAAAAAAAVSAGQEAAVVRLANFLWLLAVGGLAWLVWLVGQDVRSWPEPSLVQAVGLATLVPAAVLLRWRGSWLFQATLFASIAAVLLGSVARYEHADGLAYGPVLWGLGASWAVLAWGRLLPRERSGYVVGSLSAFAGALAIASVAEAAGIVVGLATAIAMLAATVPTRSRVLLGIGIPGFLWFAIYAVGYFFGRDVESGDPGNLGVVLVLLAVGVALVVVAVVAARRGGRAAPDPMEVHR